MKSTTIQFGVLLLGIVVVWATMSSTPVLAQNAGANADNVEEPVEDSTYPIRSAFGVAGTEAKRSAALLTRLWLLLGRPDRIVQNVSWDTWLLTDGILTVNVNQSSFEFTLRDSPEVNDAIKNNRTGIRAEIERLTALEGEYLELAQPSLLQRFWWQDYTDQQDQYLGLSRHLRGVIAIVNAYIDDYDKREENRRNEIVKALAGAGSDVTKKFVNSEGMALTGLTLSFTNTSGEQTTAETDEEGQVTIPKGTTVTVAGGSGVQEQEINSSDKDEDKTAVVLQENPNQIGVTLLDTNGNILTNGILQDGDTKNQVTDGITSLIDGLGTGIDIGPITVIGGITINDPFFVPIDVPLDVELPEQPAQTNITVDSDQVLGGVITIVVEPGETQTALVDPEPSPAKSKESQPQPKTIKIPIPKRPALKKPTKADLPKLADPHFVAKGSWQQDYLDQWGMQRVGFRPLGGTQPTAWPDMLDGEGKNAQPCIVAVIGSGVDYYHPELFGRMWFNEKEIPGNGKDDDKNGYADDVQGWNFMAKNDDVRDLGGHETHVAGVIAASPYNAYGMAGINPWAQIMALKVADFRGEANSMRISQAIF